MDQRDRVVIIGAGLCGLATAYHLEQAGFRPVVVDRSATVGGRIRTDSYRGFLLDRGFQVVLSAFPEFPRYFSENELRLRPFVSGLRLRYEGRWCELRNPLRHPFSTFGTTSLPKEYWPDLFRLVRLYFRTRYRKPAARQSIADLMDESRISLPFQDLCVRPFCGAAFLDLTLSTSASLFTRLLHWYVGGYCCLPAGGMGQLPKSLAAQLKQTTFRLESPVAEISEDGVTLSTGERIEGRAVVLAVDRQSASDLIEIEPFTNYRSTTCLYFRVDSELVPSTPLLHLDGTSEGPINHLAFLNFVQPSYAPRGQALASVSVIDRGWQSELRLEEKVRQQLAAWFHTRMTAWHHLRTYRIERALPDQSAPPPYAAAFQDSERPWLFLSGELAGPASINGSLTTGRRTAEAVIGAHN